MWQRFTPKAREAILAAQNCATQNNTNEVSGAHILLGVLAVQKPGEGQLAALIERSGLKWDELRLYAEAALENGATAPQGEPKLTPEAKQILELAADEARRGRHPNIGTSHLFVACFRAQMPGGGIAEVLKPLGVSAAQLRLYLGQIVRGETTQAAITSEHPLEQLTAHGERALEAAQAAMRASFCGRVSTLHLLIGILENPDSEAVAALETLGANVEELRQQARAALVSDGELAGPKARFTPAAKRALDRAKANARAQKRPRIGSADLILGLLPQPELWIEKAQFGARPADPAAPLIEAIDAQLLRAIFEGEPAPTATKVQRPINASATRPLEKLANQILAWLIFAIQFSIVLFLDGPRLNRTTPGDAILLALLVGVLLVAGIGAVSLMLFSKNQARKNAWVTAFVAALAGLMLGLMAGNFIK